MARKKNALTEMLEDPNKQLTKTYGANGVLSRLFRTMLRDMQIGGYKFSQLMQQFLADPRNAIPNNKKDQTSNRGNLNKEFQRGQMTWKVFCKAMRFLQIKRFEISLTAIRASGEATVHTINVDLTVAEPAEWDEDDDFDSVDGNAKLADDMPEVPYLDHDMNA